MHIAIYPGSFDPVTLGHLDIIRRSSNIFDQVVVAVVNNIHKRPAFSVRERMNFLETITHDLDNVTIRSCEGLLVDFAKKVGAKSIIRGLRAVTDFEYELQMAQTNSKIEPSIETLFMATKLEYAYLSSSIVKEVANFGGDIRDFVPPEILEAVRDGLKGEKDESN